MSNKPPPKGGYIDPAHPSPNGPQDATIIIYGYTPSLALSVLGIILFLLNLVAHVFLLLKHRLWSFSPLALGCTLEVVGYIFRTLSSQRDPYNIIYFVVQYFCIVTAPVFISASIYVCLSKLIRWASASHLLPGQNPPAQRPDPHTPVSPTSHSLRNRVLAPRGILYLFITIDILSTATQVAGAALIGSYESDRRDPTTPNNILLAGLAIQTFSFTIYLSLLVIFRLSLRDPSRSSAHTGQGTLAGAGSDGTTTTTVDVTVKDKDPFLLALTAASLLIYLRTIFRLAETSQGVYGYLSTHEVFFGVLEYAPVVVAMTVLAVWYPGVWVGKWRTRKGKTGTDVSQRDNRRGLLGSWKRGRREQQQEPVEEVVMATADGRK